MEKLSQLNSFEVIFGIQNENEEKQSSWDIFSSQKEQNSEILFDLSWENSKPEQQKSDHRYYQSQSQFYDFESHQDSQKQKNENSQNIEDLKQNLLNILVTGEQQQLTYQKKHEDIHITSNNINNNTSNNNSSNQERNAYIKDGENLVLNIYKKIHNKQGKNKKFTYRNETKNIPSIFGNILLKLLKRKIKDNTKLNKIQQIRTLKDLKELFQLSKMIQELCLKYLTSGGVLNCVANSYKIKSKRLVVKYIDRVIMGCIDPENFQAIILK